MSRALRWRGGRGHLILVIVIVVHAACSGAHQRRCDNHDQQEANENARHSTQADTAHYSYQKSGVFMAPRLKVSAKRTGTAAALAAAGARAGDEVFEWYIPRISTKHRVVKQQGP